MLIRISRGWNFAPILSLYWGQDTKGILTYQSLVQFPFFCKSKDAANCWVWIGGGGRRMCHRNSTVSRCPQSMSMARTGATEKQHLKVSLSTNTLCLRAGGVSSRDTVTVLCSSSPSDFFPLYQMLACCIFTTPLHPLHSCT